MNEELKLICMNDVQPEEVRWLWYPYIPFGKLTIIQGDPGEGKTLFALAIIAAVTKGEALPEREPGEPMNVIYQTAEDGLADTIRPRLDRLGADCSRVMVIDESQKELTLRDERIQQAIRQTGAKLIVLDPLQAYLGSDVDMHRANEVRPVMKRLGVVAEETGCAVILIRHINKLQGQKSVHRGLGSIDFQASARSVLIVGRIKDNPQIRVMVQDKSSLAPEGEPIAFELDKENGFRWIGHYDISVDDLLSGIPREKKSEQAENLILEYLSKGKYPQKELVKKAQAIGISKRVLDEAKKALNVQSVKEGSQWYWQIPEKME